MGNVLQDKTPSVSAEHLNNVLTITGPIPLTTACFEFQDASMFSNQGRLICSINMWPTAHLFIAREQKWPQPLTETLPPSGQADMIFISNKRGRGRGQGTEGEEAGSERFTERETF